MLSPHSQGTQQGRLKFHQGLGQRLPTKGQRMLPWAETPGSPVPRTGLAQTRHKRVVEKQYLVTITLWTQASLAQVPALPSTGCMTVDK